MDFHSLLFIPLGGVGHIGMNVSLYHYQGKWIMLDLGAGFADDNMPGIDMVVADINFIKKHRKDLLGIILTHAHEDHFGAVQYLWNDLRCPVFATKFTANFLKAKLKEFHLEHKVPITEVVFGQNLSLGPFNLEFVNMTHSIPEMNAVAIHTDAGTVFHTGDWKFDEQPVIGDVSDTKRLAELGNNGVLAMICDSTNVFSEGKSGSESEMYYNILKIVKECNHLVAISLFASNVARIYTIARIAQELNRKVVLLGKSLVRVVSVAKEIGYLGDIPEFLDAKQAAKIPRNQLIVICTGCQGEIFAASSKLAHNSHPLMKMEKGDTIIFSSKIIPGNEKRIYNLFNLFVNLGVKVITEESAKVHVSGHPSREELCSMYSLIKPKLSIPVHGEYIHMHEHAALAMHCGVEKTLIVKPGDVVDLVEAKKIDSVEHGYFGVDGNNLHHPDGEVMRMRRRMRDTGIVVITVIVNKKLELLKNPVIFAPGVFDSTQNGKLVDKIINAIVIDLKVKKIKKLENHIIKVVKGILHFEINKKPFIEVQIEQI